ncbi:DUF1659 domain-containing protein [Desulfosporosinus sp. BG]|uniref:DUF1659 domain-containing protein n=1 Tax=Desulfosporosinus sp. BG TaxID=1633135 RepID=UPI000839E91C|nr:DUF1659 domain-containing protein [Desulfosporosinus sp. BG]
MAVVVTPLNSALVVVYQAGLTALGAPIKRQKGLNYLRFEASEQAVHDAAHALFSLSQNPVLDVLYRKTFELTDE